MPDPLLLFGLAGAVVVAGLLAFCVVAFVRVRREAAELADEERWMTAYLDEIGWNDTGEVVE